MNCLHLLVPWWPVADCRLRRSAALNLNGRAGGFYSRIYTRAHCRIARIVKWRYCPLFIAVACLHIAGNVNVRHGAMGIHCIKKVELTLYKTKNIDEAVTPA